MPLNSDSEGFDPWEVDQPLVELWASDSEEIRLEGLDLVEVAQARFQV